ncbi:hypothetical protein HY311_00150 [Candidatus Nomurabacteria bacterium]|nr:hypothetical protein [Candidatus Nomurabacteria bacterium]
MKILQKVKPIEVKRCFVVSDFLSQKYLGENTQIKDKSQYVKRLVKAKRAILELPEGMLDMIIKGEWKKRFKAYKNMQWCVGIVKTNEVGVWKKAGGLPIAWTRGSLEETACLVAQALKKNSKKLTKRSGIAIPGILKNSISLIQKEKYLFPIILWDGTIGRKGLKKMKGNIDDGCMRSVSLAVSGKKEIKAYIGRKIKSKK